MTISLRGQGHPTPIRTPTQTYKKSIQNSYFSTFRRTNGPTDLQTDGRTDGKWILQSCEFALKTRVRDQDFKTSSKKWLSHEPRYLWPTQDHDTATKNIRILQYKYRRVEVARKRAEAEAEERRHVPHKFNDRWNRRFVTITTNKIERIFVNNRKKLKKKQ